MERASGEPVFLDVSGDGGVQRRATLRLVVDGYSGEYPRAHVWVWSADVWARKRTHLAHRLRTVCEPALALPRLHTPPPPNPPAPVTSGNFVQRVLAGQYNAARVSASQVAVLVGEPGGEDDEGGGALPLEILPAGDFEPTYRVPLDVRSGELPTLPLSIYGSGEGQQRCGSARASAPSCHDRSRLPAPRCCAVAMARLPDSSSGYVSSRQWFISKFDRTQAGLAGLSFDEGEFGVFGYVVSGLDALSKLGDGDRLVKAVVVEGADKLVLPPAAAAAAAPDPVAAAVPQ